MPTPPRRMGLDRPVLLSNLASGAVWLLIPAALGAWPLSLVGAGYVLVLSLFLGAAYGRDTLSKKQEAFVWVAPWFAAIALWVLLLSGLGPRDTAPAYLRTLWAAIAVATPCYVGWQTVALAIRQLMSWRGGPSVEIPAPTSDDTMSPR